MFKEILLRMAVGGTMVSVFALLGDVIKPKRFAGLFGAAPSVALATLTLAARTQGRMYAATEARSMVGGALAFFVYSCAVCWVLIRYKPSALVGTLSLLPLWAGVAFGIWFTWLH